MKNHALTILAATFLQIASLQAQNNEKVPGSITVSESVEKEVTPDQIFVSITLREYNDNKNKKVEIESIRNAFLSSVKSLGIPESKIVVQSYSGWNSNPIIYKKNKKADPDLKASITYLVEFANPKEMNSLSDKLDDNATKSFDITKYDYSHKKELQDSLQFAAIKAAKLKATRVAEVLGERLGHVQSIDLPATESNTSTVRPYMLMRSVAVEKSNDAGDSNDVMDVDFKKIKYSYEATIKYNIQN